MVKKNKKKTLGTMSNTRMMWQINPVTRVKPHKSKYLSRKKAKEALKSGKWDI